MTSTIASHEPRVFGTEMEYPVGDVGHIYKYIQGALPEGLARVRLFLSNGGCLYDDHGFLEYSTPECDSMYDLIHAEAAGELIAFMVASTMVEQGHIPQPDGFLKTVVDDEGNTWGYHENYLVDRKLFNRNAYDPYLISHFVSRTVETGAGRIVPTETGYDFWLAQKMVSLEKEKGQNTIHEKPLLNTRDEAHTGDDRRWARLHVVCGDPNITGRMLFQKIGETSLILRLPENGFGDPDRLVPSNPVAAARTIAQDPTLTKLIEFPDGRKLTALDMREQLIEQIEAMKQRVKDLPPEELDAFELMKATVNDLKYDRQEAATYVEWLKQKVTLDDLLERVPEDDLDARSKIVTRIRDRWSNQDPAKNLGKRIMNPGPEKGSVNDGFVDPERVTHAVYNATGTARAEGRADFILEHEAEYRDYEAIDQELDDQDAPETARFISVGWDYGKIDREVEKWSDPHAGRALAA
jgi:proteasome accessory factor A